MVKVQFVQAVRIDGKPYGLGVHDIDEALFDHPHFQKYVKIGYIVDVSDKPAVVVETLHERNLRLAKKLGVRAKAQAEKKEEESKSEDEKTEEKSEDAIESEGTTEDEKTEDKKVKRRGR